MNELAEKAKEYTDIFIFGCGEIGKKIHKELDIANLSAAIRHCDNCEINSQNLGAELLSPEEAFRKYPNALFIIGSTLYHKQMLSQLISMGVANGHIYTKLTERGSRLAAKPFLGRVEYDVVDHCNLNCAGCVHFSSLAKERFADLDEFRVTMERLVQIMGSKLLGIQLQGGEPLLHPSVEQFILSARELLPDGYIGMITNGILLKSMPESFWKICAECKVLIIMSIYALNLDYDGIKQLADKYDVRLKVEDRRNGGWSKWVLDLDGNQDITSNFSNCCLECTQLKNGRISPCGVVTGIQHFNSAFGTELEINEKDSLNIFSDITSQDVLDFLAKPIPFCRYCDISKNHYQDWQLSKRIIDEYIE